jgi:hypothetical protein
MSTRFKIQQSSHLLVSISISIYSIDTDSIVSNLLSRRATFAKGTDPVAVGYINKVHH